jgi:Cu+-exporting ATPase
MSANHRNQIKRLVFTVRDADCTQCSLAIEKKLKGLDGVIKVGSSVMLNKLYVDFDETKLQLSDIEESIQKSGYAANLIRKTCVQPENR